MILKFIFANSFRGDRSGSEQWLLGQKEESGSDEQNMGGCWVYKWPEGWEIEYPILNLYKIPSLQKGRNDEIVWVDNAAMKECLGNGSERIKDHKRSGRKVECSVSKEE
ncbi:hypothetical protein Tco_0355474 [Tanacetum coccineum]